jgi:hypothetical protein
MEREPAVLAYGVKSQKTIRGIIRRALPIILAGVALIALTYTIRTVSEQKLHKHGQDIVLCKSRMLSIAAALAEYATDHNGQYPERLEQLILDGYAQRAGLTPSDFVCPGSNDRAASATDPARWAKEISLKCSYIYVGRGTTKKSAADTPLLYEKRTNHNGAGMTVLFVDGTVEFIKDPAMERKLEQLGR